MQRKLKSEWTAFILIKLDTHIWWTLVTINCLVHTFLYFFSQKNWYVSWKWMGQLTVWLSHMMESISTRLEVSDTVCSIKNGVFTLMHLTRCLFIIVTIITWKVWFYFGDFISAVKIPIEFFFRYVVCSQKLEFILHEIIF